MGATQATDFPTTATAIKARHLGADSDGFLTKVGPDGSLIYSTYLGGTGDDIIAAVSGGNDGSVYVAGTSTSKDFPVTPGLKAFSTSCGMNPDIFISKFSNSGALMFSTFINDCASPVTLPAGAKPTALSLVVDASGQSYLTRSRCDGVGHGGIACNSALYRVSTTGNGVLKLSDFGGGFSSPAALVALALGPLGKVYVAGATFHFPLGGITSLPVATLWGIDTTGTTFLTKMFGTGVLNSFGADVSNSSASAITLDVAGNIYLAGTGNLGSQLSPGAFQTTPTNAFILKYDPQATSVTYSTYVAGDVEPQLSSIVATSDGSIFALGSVTSSKVPGSTGGFQPVFPGGASSAYVFRLNGTGSALLESSFLGGTRDEVPASLALDNAGNLFISGTTTSPNFPGDYGSVVPQNLGQYAFLARLQPNSSASTDLSLSGNCDAAAKTTAILTCQFNVSNVGTASANHVTAIVGVPGSSGVLLFVGCNSTGGGQCYGAGNDRAIRFATLGPGESRQITMSYQVVQASGASTNLTVLATLASYSQDSTPSNNAVQSTVTIIPVPVANLTITSNPAGLNFSVQDGTTYPTPHTFQGPTDQTITVTWPTSQAGSRGPNSRLVFAGWTDGKSDNPRTVTFGNETLVGFYKQQYFLTVSNQGSGTINVASDWHFDGEPVTLTATPSPCFVFKSWSGTGPGAYTGANPTISFGMLGPISETATFLAVNGPCTSNSQVVNAASFRADALAPGSIFTVFGVGLAPSIETVPISAISGWPTQTGDVQLAINGKNIPIYYVSPSQINGQIPYDVALGPAILTVLAGTQTSTPVTVMIVQSGPGIFEVGGGRAAAVNEDFSLNTPQNPSLSGSVIEVFMTGQGLVDSTIAAGLPAPTQPLIHPLLSVTATIGGQDATVEYAGLAPGFVGLLQVNIRVPASLNGELPLAIRIGNTVGNTPMVSIAAKP